MPIKIPNDLPARRILEEEGVKVISEFDAVRQDVRPLRIAMLNLMPDKIRTETQIARVVGSTPLQVEMTLLNTSTYKSRNVPERHLIDFYRTWDEVRHEKFDGLIVTGAPIETLPFTEVDYWDELTAIFDWAQTNVFRAFHLCWGAQAALHHYHGVPKYLLDQKMFGIFRHHIVNHGSGLLRGFNDEFSIPVSRHTEVRREDIPDKPGLIVLAESPEAGFASWRIGRIGRFTCSITWNMTPTRSSASTSATRRRAPTSRSPRTTSRTTTRANRRSTAGAPTPTCCSGTGSTRSTRTRLTTSPRSARPEIRRWNRPARSARPD